MAHPPIAIAPRPSDRHRRRPRVVALAAVAACATASASMAVRLDVGRPIALGVPAAHAQASDASRHLARGLYADGVTLQNAGKFAEALQKFEQAQAAFNAPTHLLHIGECQEQLHKLVEAAESYRSLVRTPLADDAPEAFVQAKQQATAQLPLVEQRIPSLKVDVTPSSIQGLTLQIDGQTMSGQLVGIPIPLNPGQHRVLATAAGYSPAELSVTLAERDARTLSLKLQQIAVAPTTTTPTPATAPPPPLPPATSPPPAPPPPPPAYEATGPAGTNGSFGTQARPSRTGLLFGVHAGLVAPFGAISTSPLQGGTNDAISQVASNGFGFGIDGGLRFARNYYIGLTYEYAALASGELATSSRLVSTSTSASTNAVGVVGAYMSNPDGLGFYGELGILYRSLTYDVTDAFVDEAASRTISATAHGGDFLLGAGLTIRAAPWLRLIPKVSISVGTFGTRDASCVSSSGTAGRGCPAIATGSIDSSAQDTHTFLFLGVGGDYNLDFGR